MTPTLRNEKVCGCILTCQAGADPEPRNHDPHIAYCPLHAAASGMRDTILAMLNCSANPDICDDCRDRARALLARIEGAPEPEALI